MSGFPHHFHFLSFVIFSISSHSSPRVAVPFGLSLRATRGEEWNEMRQAGGKETRTDGSLSFRVLRSPEAGRSPGPVARTKGKR